MSIVRFTLVALGTAAYLGLAILGWALAFRSGLGVLFTALLIPPLVARINAPDAWYREPRRLWHRLQPVRPRGASRQTCCAGSPAGSCVGCLTDRVDYFRRDFRLVVMLSECATITFTAIMRDLMCAKCDCPLQFRNHFRAGMAATRFPARSFISSCGLADGSPSGGTERDIVCFPLSPCNSKPEPFFGMKYK
jgi:hypothetical protein